MVGATRAQSGRGTVSGRVMDTSGGVLQGAAVELDPAGLTRVSDAQGEFTFTGVAAGSYTITYNFVGMEPHSATVEVKAGETVRADATLHVGSNEQEVIVTAERAHGEADALNREKSADNELQVLPSEVIRSLPNANMADGLGRLPSGRLERDEGGGERGTRWRRRELWDSGSARRSDSARWWVVRTTGTGAGLMTLNLCRTRQ